MLKYSPMQIMFTVFSKTSEKSSRIAFSMKLKANGIQ